MALRSRGTQTLAVYVRSRQAVQLPPTTLGSTSPAGRPGPHPDLMLLDLRLPDLDGASVLAPCALTPTSVCATFPSC
jgi:CheY-like chemotaxis protein